MNQNQRLNKILIASLILFLSVFIIFLNFRLVSFDLEFYNKEFEQYNPDVNDSLGTAEDLLTYLQSSSAGEEYIASFNEEEVSHLKDVKNLIQLSFWILYASAFLLIIFSVLLYNLNKQNKIEFARKKGTVLIGGGLLTLILIGVFRICLINFKSVFTKFHQIFFAQGGWQFPPDYLLVRLFPEKFFIDVIHLIVFRILITAVILLIIGVIINSAQKKIKKVLK